jgi:sugar lactone lactonase YvrE
MKILRVLAALAVTTAIAHAQSIVTVAGGGTSSQDGLPAKNVILTAVLGLAADRDGNIYISEPDANVVHRVNIADGTISIYAGNGGGTLSGDGGPARQASLKAPRGIAFDDAGNLYIADSGNRRIRRVDAVTRTITTFAGADYDPNRVADGDGGQAKNAFIPEPSGLAWSDGSLYLTDTTYDFNTVRKIDRQGVITTVAGKKSQGGFSGDGGPATEAEMWAPMAVAVDASGNLFIAERVNNRIRRVDAATRIITTVVGGGTPTNPDDVGDGGPGTAARLNTPMGLVFDASGNLLISEAYNPNGLIRKYDPVSKIITRVAGNGGYGGGDDGPALEAGLHAAFALTIDARQNIFFYDGSNGSIRRIDATSKIVTRIAGAGTFIGDGNVATAAVLANPVGLAVDPGGNLIIADPGHSLVRKVAAGTGVISSIAGITNVCCRGEQGLPATQMSIGFPIDVAIGPDGLVYFASVNFDKILRIDSDGRLTTIAGGGDPADHVGDNGPATSAQINPVAIAFDTAGNLYIVDYAYETHHRIRKVDATTRVITTIAGSNVGGFSGDNGLATSAQLDSPRGVAVDRAGNVYISDYGNGAVRRIDKATGIITTYAGRGHEGEGNGDGGPAAQSSISPLHMAIDKKNDDLYIADQQGHRLRKIDAQTRVITTVAGSGSNYLDGDFSGDNGPARSARMNFQYEVSGVALDGSGRIYIADSKNNRVRMVNVCAPVSAPTLTVPADASTTSNGPTLRWRDTSGASRFDLYVDTVNPPARLEVADLTAQSYTLSNLDSNRRYYWRVVSKGDSFCATVSTASSAASSFSTSGACAPGAFNAIAPAQGATTNTSTVTLSWEASAGASSYDVYFGNLSLPPLVASGVTTTSYNATAGSGTYSWFIVAHASCDTNRTLSTPTRSFQSTVSDNCIPGELQVALSSPAGGATDQSTTVDLSWTTNRPVTSYDLYFGTSSNPPLYSGGINATRQAVNGLASGTTYYWRVVARGPCDPSGVTSVTRSFTTRTCETPGAVNITFAPDSVTAGTTYTLVWSIAAGLDNEGGYLVERSTSSAFSTIESQVTSSTAASFVANNAGTYYHRVRAISACNPASPGPLSDVKAITVTPAKPNVVFTVLPSAIVAAIGEKIENRIGTFALENLSTQPVQIILGRQEIASPPFFSIVDPTATDAAFVTLQPRTPKSFQIRYAGPPNDRSGSYQGVIFAASTGAGLAVTPYAFVNLKIGGGAAVTPRFIVDGVASDYAAFPGFAGDDASRPPRTIAINNPGSTPMDLAAEIGPEVWLLPEANWNATPLAAGETRNVNLFTRRSRSPNGSPLPRYTYFTVRTRDGASARLIVQDNDDLPVSNGRTSRLDVSARSFIVPEVVSKTTVVTRVRLSNVGGESVQAEMIFTPVDAEGFDSPSVRRVTVVLPPNDVLTLTDPLQQLFKASRPASGSLEVRIPRERLGLVAVSAAVTGSGGGYVVPTLNRGDGARVASPHLITGITAPASLTLVETTGVDGAIVRVAFFDGNGVRKGDTVASLGRYSSKRYDDISGLIAGGAQGGRVEITVESGGGTVAAMAVIGGGDSGATLVSVPSSVSTSASVVALAYLGDVPNADPLPSVTTVVPVLGPPSSAGAAPKFATTVGFLANSTLPATFTATFRTAVGSEPVTRTVDVPAGTVKVYADIGKDLFGVSAPSGSVSVNSVVAGKVYAVLQNSNTAKPFSALPVQNVVSESLTSAAGGSQRALFYDGLEQSVDPARGTRWMLVLNEVSGTTGVVNIRLYESGNRTSAIAEKNINIGGYEQKQIDTVFNELGLEAADRKKDRTNVQVVVTAVGGTARVSAMAVSVDNQTGDTKTFSLTPSVGSASPSVNLAKVVAPPPATGTPRRRGVRH